MWSQARSLLVEQTPGALRRASSLGVVAHADDLEIGCIHGILEARAQGVPGFFGCVVTDGKGSARGGSMSEVSVAELAALRRKEQVRAAELGGYAGVVLLDHSSQAVRSHSPQLKADIGFLLDQCAPQTIYTHNPADSHATHRGVVEALYQVLSERGPKSWPEHLYACEVWRDLDWAPESAVVELDVSAEPELQRELILVFESQVGAGKRYDEAILGRRRAHATMRAARSIDERQGVILALDLRLWLDRGLSLREGLAELVRQFQAELTGYFP
jgi:LmbE family N-acetylglucosaminyl deacetylase